jgi:cellulose synthase/poly-beta-1,6-N-acetylglucosamine synthase-like glycosyltransferase
VIFSLIVFIVLFCISFAYIRNIICSHRYILKNNSIEKSKTENNVIVLLPIFQETQIIAQTFNYFYQIANKLNVRIIFITTELEGPTAKNATYLAVKKLIGEKSNVLVEHYPKTRGSKASQLNWIMEKYINQTDYFAIFDADSRPDDKGIQYVMQSKKRPAVFQMPSIYLPHESNSLASKTLAVFQTKWSYCFEIPKWRTWQDHLIRSHVMYVVGHGLFLQKNIRLSEQTITEDLELGYRLSAQRAALVVVPFFDKASVPHTFITAIIQSSRWYYGELLAPITFRQQFKDSHNVLRYTLLCLIRYGQILLWMLGPILVIIGLITAVSYPILLALGIASIGLYWLLNVFICTYRHASYDSLILMPIKLITNGVGPMLCVFYVILDLLKIKEFQFIKTKR